MPIAFAVPLDFKYPSSYTCLNNDSYSGVSPLEDGTQVSGQVPNVNDIDQNDIYTYAVTSQPEEGFVEFPNANSSTYTFNPDPNGRFNVSWVPGIKLQNNVILKNGIKYPGNEHMGAFGCDSYDISGTVDKKGSKGALHGLTKFSMESAPANTFFLEYIARPQTAEIFFEDVLMACVFYGMPILAENNKPRLLYYLKRRGYRGFSMNRPDKVWNKLSAAEKEVGGIPNSSEDIKQAHAAAIEMYICLLYTSPSPRDRTRARMPSSA